MSVYDDLIWEQLLADPTVSPSIGFIDLDYYRDIYHGEDGTDAELTKLIIRASDDINAKTGFEIVDITDYAVIIRNLVYKATAAQTEWYILNGETYNDDNLNDVEIGKFSYTGKIKGSSKNNLCKRADMFLSQTGLTFRGVSYV
jgi:hypothetical protein